STFQSGVNLASGHGENFGFGYGSLQATQVSSLWQVQNTQQQQCIQVYNIPKDANGNQFCVTSLSPVTWLGTPDYELMPTLNCNPSGKGFASKKLNQYVVPTCFGIPVPGGPLSSNPTGQGVLRLPYIHGPAYQN